MTTMWMIRGESGRLYDDFRDRGVAAIGWAELAALPNSGVSRKELAEKFRGIAPHLRPGQITSGASQVWRFINEIEIGDWAVTYSPANRTYLIGKITGDYQYREDWVDDDMPRVRTVAWEAKEIERDSLQQPSKNSLGSTLTLFRIPELAVQDLFAQLNATHAPAAQAPQDIESDEADPLDGIESLAIERIKDMVVGLGWDEMQDLVAGILRAMGYKTQVSTAGPDRGKDIVASPDGFGFENPRIVVEVKHRNRGHATGVRSCIATSAASR